MRIALTRIAAAAALAVSVVALTAAPASAAPIPGRVKALSVGSGAISVEYGQDWNVSATSCIGLQSYSVSEGAKQLYSDTVTYSYSGSYFGFGSYNMPPLSAGKHTLTVTAQSGCGAETATVTITVSKAPLTFDARITADPNAPGNAIITSQAIGDFMDRLPDAVYRDDNSARFPAGTWKIAVVDDSGASVHEDTIAGKVGDPGYISAYWLQAPEDASLTATVEFTPSGSLAGDFTVTQPAPFGYTTGQTTNAGLTKPADDGPPRSTTPTGFTLPVWSLVAAGVLAVAAIAVGIVFAIRLRRRLQRLDVLESALIQEAPRAS
jgi:hypothetical protein